MAKKRISKSVFALYFTCSKTNPKTPHEQQIYVKNSGTRKAVTDHFAKQLPSFYSSASAARIQKLGFKKTANLLKLQMPLTKTARSGDLGEVVAHEFANAVLGILIPIKKLRWKDSREMAMRGDDIVGMSLENGKIKKLFKFEVKSRAQFSSEAMSDIERQLSKSRGRPSTHTLLFIADRLHERGDEALFLDFSKLCLNGVRIPVEQIGFVFVGSDPSTILSESLKRYTGKFKRTYIGVRVEDHQDFIAAVFQKVSK